VDQEQQQSKVGHYLGNQSIRIKAGKGICNLQHIKDETDVYEHIRNFSTPLKLNEIQIEINLDLAIIIVCHRAFRISDVR